MKDPEHGREAAIRGLHAYRAELRTTLEQIQEDLRAVERSIQLLSAGETATSPQVSLPRNSGYAGLKPQAAVERLLHECPTRKLKPSLAAKELLRRGCPKSGKQWTSVVACALSRAVGKGIAVLEKVDGRNAYRLKPDREGHDKQGEVP